MIALIICSFILFVIYTIVDFYFFYKVRKMMKELNGKKRGNRRVSGK